MQTIVIGHKNPDMDSICAALAYAELKRLQGQHDVVAARAGATNQRIDYVLAKFGWEAPRLITDLSPKVLDVMEPDVVSVRSRTTVYDALQHMEQKQLRALPVVDDGQRCLGMLSAFKVNSFLFPPREEASSSRVVTASLADIVATVSGRVVSGTVGDEPLEYMLMVAAMAEQSLAARLQRYPGRRVVLFVGDRPNIHSVALRAGVSAIFITGDFPIEPAFAKAAAAAGIPLVTCPYDTATTVLLARGAVRVERVLTDEYTSFHFEMPLDEARPIAAQSRGFTYPVLDDSGALVGILAKSDFLKPIPRQLILVDHNELTQAVRGADQVPIIEILDHHKLGGFASHSPILFWNNPVGSTSSIVAMCYRQAGIPIPARVAGLLMAGLISDTLLLTSPTTTQADRQLLQELAEIAGCDAPKLAEEIFSIGSPLLTMTPDQAVAADCKLYDEAGLRFTVAQVEELTFAHFEEKREALLQALGAHQQAERLLFAALLVTDINTQTSLLLLRGHEDYLATIDYPQTSPHVWELAGVVSRKKQLLPYLLTCLQKARPKLAA
jgi:manganese-dependent inorganic pyrophosphatase